MSAINVVRKFFPKFKTVVDAKTNAVIEVTAKDASSKAVKDHNDALSKGTIDLGRLRRAQERSMIPLLAIAALVLFAWMVAPKCAACPLCGGRAWMCGSCAAAATRKLMASNAPRPGQWTDEDEAGSTAYLYGHRSAE